MTDVAVKKVPGGAGLSSQQVGAGCGLHKNHAGNRTLLDFSAASASTENVLCAPPTPCTIQRQTLTVNEAIAAAATVKVGLIRGTTSDDDFFGTLTTAAAVAAGTVLEIPVLSDGAVLAGDVVTVAQSAAGSGGAGTGWVAVEYTVDDEHN